MIDSGSGGNASSYQMLIARAFPATYSNPYELLDEADLQELSVNELMAKCLSQVGCITEEMLDQAKESEEPKSEIIALILENQKKNSPWKRLKPKLLTEFLLHGCIYWVLNIAMTIVVCLCASGFTCRLGLPGWVFAAYAPWISLSLLHERSFLQIKTPYYKVPDMWGPAKEAVGMDRLEIEYGHSVFDLLDTLTDCLFVVQAIICAPDVHEQWMDTWNQSFLSPLSPFFDWLGYGRYVMVIWIITVASMQGVLGFYRGLRLISTKDEFIGAGHASELAEWTSMKALASALRKLNIEDAKNLGERSYTKRIEEGERADLTSLARKIAVEHMIQMWLSVGYFQLTFHTKSTFGRATALATTLLSMMSALNGAAKAGSLKIYKRSGWAIGAFIILFSMLVACKIVGAFLCESHNSNTFPPNCVQA